MIDDVPTHEPTGSSPLTIAAQGAPALRLVGRYVLLEERGRGGLGQVFAAYDPQLARRVAVKVVHPEAGQGEDRETASLRLLREAQIAARISHPNVVTIHDSGRDGEVVYIAMELVAGIPLSAWLRLRERSWSEIRDAFVQAALGLAAAHAQGLVHRDFKPANVIMGDDGRARVLDFGLARLAQYIEPTATAAVGALGANLTSSKVTATGWLMGTPAYLAPEQLDHRAIGPAADQFSFCVALYEALYREHPFPTYTLGELPTVVDAGLPAPPRGSRVPRWLHAALARGLRRAPDARHASMSSLLRELRQDRRRRHGLALGLAAGLLASVGIGGALWAWPPTEITAAERGRLDELVTAARAAAARFDYLYPPLDQPETTTAYTKVLELERLDGPLGDPGRARAGDLREEFATALIRVGDDVSAREGGELFAADFYAQALVFDPDNSHALARVSMTPPQLEELRARAARGDYTEQELTAAALLTVVAEPEPEHRVEKLNRIYSSPNPPSPLQTARLECLIGEDEKSAIEQALRPDAPDVADAPGSASPAPRAPHSDDAPRPVIATSDNRAAARSLTGQARRALSIGKWERAESLFHQALERQTKYAPALAGLAELHFERGRYPLAIQFGTKAVQISPRRASYRLLLGDGFQKVFEYRKAKDQYQQAARLGNRTARARLADLEAQTGG